MIARIDLLREGGPALDCPCISQIEGGSAKFGYGWERRVTGFPIFFAKSGRPSCCTASRRTLRRLRKPINELAAEVWRNTKLVGLRSALLDGEEEKGANDDCMQSICEEGASQAHCPEGV